MRYIKDRCGTTWADAGLGQWRPLGVSSAGVASAAAARLVTETTEVAVPSCPQYFTYKTAAQLAAMPALPASAFVPSTPASAGKCMSDFFAGRVLPSIIASDPCEILWSSYTDAMNRVAQMARDYGAVAIANSLDGVMQGNQNVATWMPPFVSAMRTYRWPDGQAPWTAQGFSFGAFVTNCATQPTVKIPYTSLSPPSTATVNPAYVTPPNPNPAPPPGYPAPTPMPPGGCPQGQQVIQTTAGPFCVPIPPPAAPPPATSGVGALGWYRSRGRR